MSSPRPPTGLDPRLTLPTTLTAPRLDDARMTDATPSLESPLVVAVASTGPASGDVGDSSMRCLSEAGDEAATDAGNCAVLNRLEDRCTSAADTVGWCCCCCCCGCGCCFASAAICREQCRGFGSGPRIAPRHRTIAQSCMRRQHGYHYRQNQLMQLNRISNTTGFHLQQHRQMCPAMLERRMHWRF